MTFGLYGEHSYEAGATTPAFIAYAGRASASGLPDYDFPIATFQASLLSESRSYCSIQVPYVDETIDALLERESGEVAIRQTPVFRGGVVGTSSEIFRFNVDEVSYSRGARSSTARVSGSRYTTFKGGAISLPTDAIESIESYGTRTAVRLVINRAWPRPLDSLEIGGVVYLVRKVSYAVTPTAARLTALCDLV